MPDGPSARFPSWGTNAGPTLGSTAIHPGQQLDDTGEVSVERGLQQLFHGFGRRVRAVGRDRFLRPGQTRLRQEVVREGVQQARIPLAVHVDGGDADRLTGLLDVPAPLARAPQADCLDTLAGTMLSA